MFANLGASVIKICSLNSCDEYIAFVYIDVVFIVTTPDLTHIENSGVRRLT